MEFYDLKLVVRVKCWKDKQTGHWLMYSRKYEISSYGKTRRQAEKMFLHMLSEYLLATKPKVGK